MIQKINNFLTPVGKVIISILLSIIGGLIAYYSIFYDSGPVDIHQIDDPENGTTQSVFDE